MDALLLARIQSGFTISFHVVFPAITIGLASHLAVIEALRLRTKNTKYRDLHFFRARGRRRDAWLVSRWAAGVVALGVVALASRAVMHAIGQAA